MKLCLFTRYDFSEPQFGKDVCDRIISPMKGAIRRYCNEGHNIMTASDMHEALKARQVKGSTAAVCELGRVAQEVKVNRITNFSSFHNFSYEEEGLRISKAYGVGVGRLIPWSELIVKTQDPTLLKEVDEHEFFATVARAIKPSRDCKDPEGSSQAALFECQEPGCSSEFSTSEGLQDHVYFGQHDQTGTSEGLYDRLRRDWASKFSSLVTESKVSATTEYASVRESTIELCDMGWALQKPRGGGTRFSEKVKEYLKTRFDIGEETGRKADPAQVAAEMRKARETDGTRRFERSEWLTKAQVQGFFSRLASSKRRNASQEVDEDDESLVEDELNYLDEKERQNTIDEVVSQVGLIHPITYDGYDVCENVRLNTLSNFNVITLKAMCSHFQLPYKTREVKASLINKLTNMVQECSCSK